MIWGNISIFKLFHDGGCYHIETSLLICRAIDPPLAKISDNDAIHLKLGTLIL